MAGALSLRHLNLSASRLPAPSCVEMSMLARAQGKGQTTAARSAGVGACFVLSVFNSSVQFERRALAWRWLRGANARAGATAGLSRALAAWPSLAVAGLRGNAQRVAPA